MRKFLTIFFSLTVAFSAQSQELWTSLEAETALTNKLSVDATAEFRWQQSGTLLKTGFGEVGASYRIFKPLTLGASYRFSQRSRDPGFFSIHTFAATLGYRYRIGDFRLQYRNKFETDRDTYITSEEDLRWHFTDRNRIRVTYYKRGTLLSPSMFVESFNEISAQHSYTLSELRYGANLTFMLYRGYSIGVGGFVKQAFDKSEFTYVGTFALMKEF